ncbi:MAG: alpha/beta hydrolase [Gemmatimonadaceae bacterium]
MPQPLPTADREGFTTTTPIPLYWREDGPIDAPSLVLLHGGPGAHHEYLYPQMLALSATHRLLTYDQRGGGRSRTDEPTPITWETQVADLATVLAERAPSAPVLVGYSWGGLLALLYLLTRPQHPHWPAPARVVVIAPAPITRRWRAQFESTLAERQRGPVIQALREALAVSGLRERDPDAYRQRSFELSVAGYFADPDRATDLTPFRVTGKVQQSVWDSLGDFDLRDALGAVAATPGAPPVLVVHGRQDPIPLASAEAVATALHGSLVVLEDCGHVPYVEQPAALFAALQAFIG